MNKSAQINKVLPISCNKDNFFELLLAYLTPKHYLTKGEQKYLAACLRNRYELSKSITDEIILDETCMNEVYRTKIRKEVGYTAQQAQNIISKLKKLKIFIPRKYPFNDKVQYYKIAPSLIFNYKENEDFALVLMFTHEEQRDNKPSSEGVQQESSDD